MWAPTLLPDAGDLGAGFQHQLERVDPLARTLALVASLRPRHRGPGGQEGPGTTDEELLRLVMQHASFLGYDQVLRMLEHESGLVFVDPGLNESRLVALVRRAMQSIDELYHLYMNFRREESPELRAELDECLYRLGLLEVDDGDGELGNLWLEKEVGGSVKAATVNQLILKLTSEVESDVTFLKTFLMTYQSFIKPKRLLAKLMERFEIPPNAVSPADAVKIKSRCVNVLKQWLNTYPDDFNDGMIDVLSQFVAKMGAGVLADSLRQPLSRLHKKRSRKQGQDDDAAAKKKKSKAKHGPPPPEPIVNLKTIFLPSFSISMVDVEEMARQLTLMFHGTFARIRPSEMLDAAWTKPNKLARAPNVCQFIQQFNHLSYLVAHSILLPKTASTRGAMYRYWVRVAQHFLRLNNFTGIMAIVGAVNMSAVHRLKQTVKEVPAPVRVILSDIEKLMNSSSSFRAYREHVANCLPPAVPYVGLLLQDLTFIETNPNRVDGGLVSWSKRVKIYESIDGVLNRFQDTEYNLQHVPQITQFIAAQPSHTEEELFQISLDREPRK